MLLLVFGIINLVFGTIMCLAGDGSEGGYGAILFGLPSVIIGFFQVAIKKENLEESNNWFNKKYSQNELNADNIKIEIKKDIDGVAKEVLVLSNDNKLYYGDMKKNRFVEITKNKILKVDCSYKTSTKTIKKPISLVGTYKTITDLTGVEISIITDSETYSMLLGKFGININAERAERLALILNDIIENSKNQNRKINVVENKTTLNDSNNSNEGYCINCGAKVIAKFCGECGTQNYKYNAAGDEA